MRLNKYLAKAGIASRRESDRMIQATEVTVNGAIEMNPAYQVVPGDVVKVNGRLIEPVQDPIILAFHKPANVITTAKDPQGRKTIFHFLNSRQRLFPVGRLDKDTTGLLLVTNDGELANTLMHPRNQIPRLYHVEIDRRFQSWELKRMTKGVYIGMKEWANGEVVEQKTVKKRTTVTLKLHQGKKREIRRLMYRMKRKVFSLQRFEFGPIKLGSLPEGHWRELTKKEKADLNQLKKNKPDTI